MIPKWRIIHNSKHKRKASKKIQNLCEASNTKSEPEMEKPKTENAATIEKVSKVSTTLMYYNAATKSAQTGVKY